MNDSHPIPTNPRFKDLTGKVIHKWTVLAFAGRNKAQGYQWTCRCECGQIRIVSAYRLIHGITMSCNNRGRESNEAEFNEQLKARLLRRLKMMPSGCWEWQGARSVISGFPYGMDA